MNEEQLREIRKTYIIALALNIQYKFIKEYVNQDLRKAINEAKAKNSHFIKIIDQYMQKRRVGQDFINEEEEQAFKYLEELDKLI
jgi:rRNA-processing protein FCF1